MKSINKAYKLWLLGGFGCLGLHRYYLNKPKTGRLFQFTLGFFFLGCLHDLFYLPTMVKICNANLNKQELNISLKKITIKKNTALKAKNYESASFYRDKENEILSEIENINLYLIKNHIF